MSNKKEMIKILNKILEGELTAINQYILHARLCKSWGYQKIFQTIEAESAEEMIHAQQVIDRILFLEGAPFMQARSVVAGNNIKEQLEASLDLELKGLPPLEEGIALSTELKDHGTKDLLRKILMNEEEHVDWLRSQLHLMSEVGEKHYLAQQIHAN